MKKSFLLLFLFLGLGLQAQDITKANAPEKAKLLKLVNSLNKFSFTATTGTPSFSTKELNSLNLNKISSVSLADLNISYKMNSRFSFGISMMGNLGNCTSGFYNQEGAFTTFGDDDDEDDDDEIDDDDDEIDDDDDDECDDDDLGNLMGSATFKLSDKFPLFVQASGGYSFGNNAPAYTAMIGYHQKIFAGFGILGGIRFSDVLYKKPADAVSVTSSSGFKAELGLSWNF